MRCRVPQINLSDEEVLALRWLLDRCDVLDGDLRQNCPFVYHYSSSALQILGGEVRGDEVPGSGLWDHPLAARFYAGTDECAGCGDRFPKTDMGMLIGDNPDDGVYCQECRK